MSYIVYTALNNSIASNIPFFRRLICEYAAYPLRFSLSLLAISFKSSSLGSYMCHNV